MPIPRAALLLSGILCVSVAACASSRSVVYVAPTNQTIRAGTDLALGVDGQHIHVTNSSTVPIMVTGLRLTDCENIKNTCETMRLRVRVAPGHRRNVVLVRPDNPNRAYSFRYTYTWEPEREP